ncbi:MAG: UDP-N-acetylglucosamine 2-epimerase (non-hydrolyzing) [Rubrivivax sp.]
MPAPVATDPTPIRLLTVLGTRPEAIKLAPIVRACLQQPRIEHRLCSTGQHRQMLDHVLQVFGLTPDEDLQLMRPGQSLNELAAAAMLGVQRVIRSFKPDWVMVQGDTTTAFTAALAAFHERVRVVHVEAGLRTGNLQSPWPEELNRRAIGLFADLHCAPTEWAAGNLRREGIADERIVVTGNSVIDALHWVDSRPDTPASLQAFLGPLAPVVLGSGRRIILVTGHRRENLDAGLAQMCQSLKRLAARGNVEIVYPVHLNPAVRQQVQGLLSDTAGVHLTEPMDHPCFVAMLRRCHFVITDSGGVQEEAPGLGKPVLVTRDTTERPEAIEAGTALLVGRDGDRLVQQATRLLDDGHAYAAMAQARNPYGDGHAAERTVAAILQASGTT